MEQRRGVAAAGHHGHEGLVDGYTAGEHRIVGEASLEDPRGAAPCDARAGGEPCRQAGAVDLYWLPLGAGGHCVRYNGRVYEAISAMRTHRGAQPLYHSALEVHHDGTRWTIEMAPAWNDKATERGVVQEGPVGTTWLARSRLFRYEVRRWRGGHIPDVDEAVDSPQRVGRDPEIAAALLRLVTTVPPLTWGRDELGCGDMWNSNSLVAWLLASTGHDLTAISPPGGGRAPGWSAGLALAARRRA